MLNPSTADAYKLDPTVRRCMGFSQRWGYDGFMVLNIFALRSTDPRGLWSVDDAIGQQNERVIQKSLEDSRVDRIVAAWGSVHRPPSPIPGLLLSSGRTIQCLGKTKSGDPKHPLYIRNDTKLEVWNGRRS